MAGHQRGKSTTKAKKKIRSRRKKSALKPEPHVHGGMKIIDIIALHPQAADVLASHGLHCASCAYGSFDTLEEGVLLHNMDTKAFDALLADLETLMSSMPQRPRSLALTLSGATALAAIAKQEGKIGEYLRVIAEEGGGFCLEFTAAAEKDDYLVHHPDVSDITVIASPTTLSRIGGASIDHREGRFKLDLEAAHSNQSCCSSNESCACSAFTKEEPSL